MIRLTRRTTLALAAISLVATSLSATDGKADPADGKAEGTLTVNGKTVKVAYAYARSVPGFFDKNTNDTKEGKLHAFEITIDATGTPVSTAWRHNGFDGPMPSGLSSADVFTKKVLDDKVVAGSYKSAAEEEFFGNTYAFDVTFRAAIAR